MRVFLFLVLSFSACAHQSGQAMYKFTCPGSDKMVRFTVTQEQLSDYDKIFDLVEEKCKANEKTY